MTEPKVSIIVVSFNTKDLTLESLRSVYRETTDASVEVIVLDNASSDGSANAIAAEFPQVKLIRSQDNLGFGPANNLSARQARGSYLLLLNPDTIVLDGAIQKLCMFAKGHPEAGIWGGRTLFADGSLNPSSCWAQPTLWSVFCQGVGLSTLFPRSQWFDPESMGHWMRDTVREVHIVTGCLLLITKDLWDRLGGFDPAFFMYGEEADLCLRARGMGVKCLICPEATIIHYGGASEQIRADKMVRLFRARTQLFNKHWGGASARFARSMLCVRALNRLLGSSFLRLISPRWQASYAEWREIWRRRGQWMNPS